jgi:enterochelin esterase-like enzyme
MLRLLLPCFLLLGLLACRAAADEKPRPLTPWQLRALVAQKPTGDDLEHLRQQIDATFSKADQDARTAKPKVEEGLACWVVRFPGSRPPGESPSGDGKFRLVQTDGEHQEWLLTPIAPGDDHHVLFLDLPNPSELNYAIELNKERLGKGQVRIEFYNFGPDSYPQDVPKGTVTKYEWKSQIFANTVRDYWVYVPAQYDPKVPACVMVFQDGGGYVGDQFRVPAVFDNLIARKEIPVIIGIFINPGNIPQEGGKPPVSNRSFEYDTLSDQYARFLLEEIIPEVSKKYSLRTDPGSRAICGISSGGICAWTVAWEKPDQFGKVLSHVGSFTNIRGGHVYPALIRKNDRKDIRVYLQDGIRDLDNQFGNWPLANQEMASALKFKGYDYVLDMGPGFHSGKYGGAHLPEEMRWLWRDWRPKD